MSDIDTNTIKLLRKARKLLDRPERWTKHEYARNKAGRRVDFSSRSAVCWCLEGALSKYYSQCGGARVYDSVLAALCKAMRQVEGTGALIVFNDAPRRTHAQVLALLDKAIGKAQKGT